MTGRWLLAWTLMLAACGGEAQTSSPRCAQCGMRTDTAPRWVAGLGDERFDAPKCLFRYARAQGGDPALLLREAWFTDYYGGTRRTLDEVTFVVGSDVVSPMGDDLVPLLGDTQVERFVADHQGRSVAPNEVDEALIAELQ